jgi:hypothetical protein
MNSCQISNLPRPAPRGSSNIRFGIDGLSTAATRQLGKVAEIVHFPGGTVESAGPAGFKTGTMLNILKT